MSRKAYSEQEREQVREALLTTVIQCIVDRGLIHSSIDVLCRKVGISKTFFYTFFSSKEELVLQALRYQQPKLLQYAQHADGRSSRELAGGSQDLFGDLVAMVQKAALPCCPSRRNKRFTVVSPKKTFRLSARIRSNCIAVCSRFLAFPWAALIRACLAIWPFL